MKVIGVLNLLRACSHFLKLIAQRLGRCLTSKEGRHQLPLGLGDGAALRLLDGDVEVESLEAGHLAHVEVGGNVGASGRFRGRHCRVSFFGHV